MIAAWLGALAVGLSLGLLGSGGSILTVPVLVYLVGQPEKVAVAGSLFVVGTVALTGSLDAAARRGVDWRSVAVFGLPGMAGTWLGARLSAFVPGAVQLSTFAVVALAAAALMMRGPVARAAGAPPRALWKGALDGLAVGLLTGFVGVGGGFLIVPALVLLGGLPIHLAVGTSLTIIAMSSFTGFASHAGLLAGAGLALDWRTLGVVAGVGVAGSLLGRRLGRRLPQTALRRLFAVALVAVGVFVLWRSLPEALAATR